MIRLLAGGLMLAAVGAGTIDFASIAQERSQALSCIEHDLLPLTTVRGLQSPRAERIIHRTQRRVAEMTTPVDPRDMQPGDVPPLPHGCPATVESAP